MGEVSVGEADVPGTPGDATDDGRGDPTDPTPPLLWWSLAAFHAATLVALLVAVMYATGRAGDLLAGLDTSVGVAAYGYLWAVTWWTNRRWLAADGAGIVGGRPEPRATLLGAVRWGGVTGVLAFLPVAVVGLALLVGAGGVDALPFVLLGIASGTVLAVGVGGIVGGGLGALDLLLLRAATGWLDVD